MLTAHAEQVTGCHMSEKTLLARVFNRLARRDLDASLAASFGTDVVARLLAALVENGFSVKTDTWLADGQMKPISADEMRVGIGEALLFELTSKFAVSTDEIAETLGEHLPQIVRQLRASNALSSEPRLS